MKFAKLILRKNVKIFATRCLILGLKCTKNRSQLGLSAPPDPLAGFGGPTSKGRGGEGRGGERREGERRGGEGRGGDGRGWKGKEGEKGKERTTAIPNFFRPWRCGTIGSRQSAATSEIVKRCWSRV